MNITHAPDKITTYTNTHVHINIYNEEVYACVPYLPSSLPGMMS